MTTNIVNLFDFKSNRIRVTLIDGEPWFVAADVCRALGYMLSKRGPNVTMACCKLKEGEVALKNFEGTPYPLKLVSESGLYKLIMRSNKREAVEFQDWVTREVLPAIRKTGGYMLKGADREKIAEGTTKEFRLPKDFADALRMLADQVERNEKLSAEVTELRPKAEVADRIAGTQGSFSLRDVAKRKRQAKTAACDGSHYNATFRRAAPQAAPIDGL